MSKVLSVSIQTEVFWLRHCNRKRKIANQLGTPNAKKRCVQIRQLERDAKVVRENSISSDAIHLASSQEFEKCGDIDAGFIVRQLAKDPTIATYLRKSLKRINGNEKRPDSLSE